MDDGTELDEARKAGQELIANAVEFFSLSDQEQKDGIIGALLEMHSMSSRYPTRMRIIRSCRLRWYGCLPLRGATQTLADEFGISERQVNKHLNSIVSHPTLGRLLVWQKQH